MRSISLAILAVVSAVLAPQGAEARAFITIKHKVPKDFFTMLNSGMNEVKSLPTGMPIILPLSRIVANGPQGFILHCLPKASDDSKLACELAVTPSGGTPVGQPAITILTQIDIGALQRSESEATKRLAQPPVGNEHVNIHNALANDAQASSSTLFVCVPSQAKPGDWECEFGVTQTLK